MTPWIESFNATSGAWASWMWRVSWQAAVVIAVAALLTMALRQRPAWLRWWIWRLAYLKLVLLMVWTTPVDLAVLPPAEQPDTGGDRAAVERHEGPVDRGTGSSGLAAAAGEPHTDGGLPDRGDALATEATESQVRALPANRPVARTMVTSSPSTTSSPSLLTFLLLGWLGGLVLVVAWLGRDAWRTVRLIRSSQIVDRPELGAMARLVCEQLHVRHRTLRLAESPLAPGPLLVKFAAPMIVVPRGLWDRLTADEVRLVLAHEIAHLKRHDLAWNALATVVQAVLHFHPLVWLAQRLARQEQELACDELVVTSLDANVEDYGRMLVKVVQQLNRSYVPRAALGISDGFTNLSRRIEAMKYLRKRTWKQTLCAGCGIAAIGMLAMVPWRLVAQEATPAPAAVASKTSPAESESTDAVAEPTDVSSPEELLVGTWRGGDLYGKLTFYPDGTFSEFPEYLVKPVAFVMRDFRSQKRWQIKADRLIMTQQLTPSSHVSKEQTEMAAIRREFIIIRMDRSFLRFAFPMPPPLPAAPVARASVAPAPIAVKDVGQTRMRTLFYRRLADITTLESLKGQLPLEVLNVAEFANMDSAEALAFADLIKGREFEDRELQLVQRVAAAEQSTIGLRELFGFSDAEVAAYTELVKLTNGFSATSALAKQGLLSGDEQSAVQKMRGFADAFMAVYSDFVAHGLIHDPGVDGYGRGGGGVGAVGGRMGMADSRHRMLLTSPFLDSILNAKPVARFAEEDTVPKDAATQESMAKLNVLFDKLLFWLAQGPFLN